MNKITLNYKEIFPVLEIAKEYLKTYQTSANNDFVNMIKFYSSGDGKMLILINNFDIKVKFIIDIKQDIQVDKIYKIDEIYSIFKGMKIYSEVEYYPEIDKITYISASDEVDDAMFYLNPVPEIPEVFDIEEMEITESKTSELSDFLKKELMSIKNILSLKSKHSNIYFYTENDMVFNFYNIYVKKQKTLKFINSDIIGLQFLIYVFTRYDSSEFEYGINENKFIFKSNEFYIEGHNINIEDEELKYINTYFENFRKMDTVNLKLEFLNFVNTVFALSPKSCLIFDDNCVRVETADTEIDDINAEFKIEFEGYFIIFTITMMKMLQFVLKNSNKLDEFEITLGYAGRCKWLSLTLGDTTIITDIGGNIKEMTEVDDSEYEPIDADELFGESSEGVLE
jgi:hypothetical protein